MLLYSTGKPAIDYARYSVDPIQYKSDACLYCWESQRAVGSRYCGSTCTSDSYHFAPGMLLVPDNHEAFKDIQTQFRTDWCTSSKPVPRVKRIYKIMISQGLEVSFNTYAAQVGNVQRYWHGTSHEGVVQASRKIPTVCDSESCALCCIIRGSYSLARSGYHYTGRFGRGIYTTRFSSTADKYSTAEPGDRWKALLLNKVACGWEHPVSSTASWASRITGPPAGYHSVVSKDVPHNGHECVVYNENAIRPSWLVLYEEK